MCSFRQLCNMLRKNKNASSVSADVADEWLLTLLCDRGTSANVCTCAGCTGASY